MLETLRATNPSSVWTNTKFSTAVVMSNGKTTVWKFDMTTPNVTPDLVHEHCAEFILACPNNEFGEYLSVTATIADLVNQRIALVQGDVIQHVSMATLILEDLRIGQNGRAYVTALSLAQNLLAYEPQASRVWTNWIESVLDYAIPPESLENY